MLRFVLNEDFSILFMYIKSIKSFNARKFRLKHLNACGNPFVPVRFFGTCFVFLKEPGRSNSLIPARFLHLFKFGLVV